MSLVFENFYFNYYSYKFGLGFRLGLGLGLGLGLRLRLGFLGFIMKCLRARNVRLAFSFIVWVTVVELDLDILLF